MSPETSALLATVNWWKSSRSGDQGACVEVAIVGTTTPTVTTVAVRDSKDPAGPVLLFSPASWTAFTTTLTASPTFP